MRKGDLEQKFWHFVDLLTQICVVSALFLLCSLPLVTIGASASALYSCLMRYQKDGGRIRARVFFREFAALFAKATLLWIAWVLLLAVLVLDVRYYLALDTPAAMAAGSVVAALLSFLLLGGLWVFPCLARFEGSVRVTVKRAMRLCLRNLPAAIGVAFLHVAIPLAGVMALHVLLLICPGVVAYLSCKLVNGAFVKNIPGGCGVPRF